MLKIIVYIHFLFFSFLMVLFCGKNLSFKFLQRIRGKTHRTRGILYFSFNGKLYSMGFSFGWLLHTSQMMKPNYQHSGNVTEIKQNIKADEFCYSELAAIEFNKV